MGTTTATAIVPLLPRPPLGLPLGSMAAPPVDVDVGSEGWFVRVAGAVTVVY
jgi:hypothetical protein